MERRTRYTAVLRLLREALKLLHRDDSVHFQIRGAFEQLSMELWRLEQDLEPPRGDL
jgi:hypothetical protein